jgi:hypothetical protein
MMPRKMNKRKAIQAEKRAAKAAEDAHLNKRCPGKSRIGLIALLLRAGAVKAMTDKDGQP